MRKPVVAFLLLVVGTGCAGPTIATREVQREATWFVRLDTYADAKAAAGFHFDHPATWPVEDVAAIMGRFQVQERVALLEQTPPPQPCFSPEEIRRLAPPVQKALRTAGPSEWVVFYVGRPAGTAQEVTSGGFFLKEGQLHVVIANQRERVLPGSDGAEAVRVNPMRSLGGRAFRLMFDPPRYILTTQANWMGGPYGPPANEVKLDHTAFLADTRPPAPAAPSLAPPARAEVAPAPPPPPASPSPAPASEGPSPSLGEQMRKLQKEVESLRQMIEDQETEIDQLKARLSEMETSKGKPTPKKPPR
jgi:hypothetical protein